MSDVEDRELELAWKRVLATEDGQMVIANIMKIGNLMGSTYSANPTDHAFIAGRRQLTLEILNRVEDFRKDIIPSLIKRQISIDD